MAITQQEAYFKIADADKDGVVGGAEAVKFFLRSGLSQETLGQVRSSCIATMIRGTELPVSTLGDFLVSPWLAQIWEYASNGGASLNSFQFQTALRLVSLAQVGV
jgi:epidermal growth factor receptor substrate 15